MENLSKKFEKFQDKLKDNFSDVKNFKKWDRTRQIFLLLVILIALPFTVYLVRSFAIYLSRAAAARIFYSPSPIDLAQGGSGKTANIMVDLADNGSVVFVKVEGTFNNNLVNLSGEITPNNDKLTTVIEKTSMSEANSTGRFKIALSLPTGTSYPSGVISIAQLPLVAVSSTSTQTAVNVDLGASQIVDVSGGTSHEVALTSSALAINLNPSVATSTPTGTSAPTASPTPPPEGTVVLKAIEDSYVNEDHPTTNYGDALTLSVDGDPELKATYLKFDLSNIAPGSIQSAVLRLRVSTVDYADSSTTQTIKRVYSNDWSESTITYNHRPSLTTSIGSISTGLGSKGQWQEVDLTGFFKGREGTIQSIGISATSTSWDGVEFDSSESANSPQLVIATVATETGTPTSTPSPTTPPNTPTPTTALGDPSTTLSLHPLDSTPALNDTFVTDVNINTHGNQVIGVELDINFDQTRLRAVDIVPGTFFTDPDTTNKSIDNTNGVIRYTLVLIPESTPVTGAGNLAKITFEAVDTGVATMTFGTANIVAAVDVGSDRNALLSTSGASVTIQVGSCRQEGDINEDGRVDILDYGILFSEFGKSVNTPGVDARADLNGDGLINILDYVILFENYGKSCEEILG
jgi:hypothetical protein